MATAAAMAPLPPHLRATCAAVIKIPFPLSRSHSTLHKSSSPECGGGTVASPSSSSSSLSLPKRSSFSRGQFDAARFAFRLVSFGRRRRRRGWPVCVLPLTEENVEKVLDEVRPGLMADGGNVVLHEIDGLVVVLKLQGACGSCPSSTMTLKMGIETRLRDKIPEIQAVEQILDTETGLELNEENVEKCLPVRRNSRARNARRLKRLIAEDKTNPIARKKAGGARGCKGRDSSTKPGPRSDQVGHRQDFHEATELPVSYRSHKEGNLDYELDLRFQRLNYRIREVKYGVSHTPCRKVEKDRFDVQGVKHKKTNLSVS
uniref:NIF system FeS cluster assembly NifU C-terminal domain-containing protein n=1 Tax=Ananas comosus var. bracteatus TaxID=296719 RepID=A0A6V7P5C0_ANACO|nr:unnamed protein product [Ananas comosus var. bracteatus]